jgi:ComF family protein
VLAFKKGRPELAHLLAGQMVPEAGRLAAHAPLVLPVPLHWSRLLTRGYNQSALLSSRIARSLGLAHDVDLLRRIRRTRSSQGLNRAARQRNVAGAFALRSGGDRLVAGRAILLVDDVLTTGVTATAVTALLRRKGALRVDVVCFARVSREHAAAGGLPVGPEEAL